MSPLLEEYLAYDLVGEAPELRPATSYATLEEDSIDQNSGTAIADALAALRHPTILLTAERVPSPTSCGASSLPRPPGPAAEQLFASEQLFAPVARSRFRVFRMPRTCVSRTALDATAQRSGRGAARRGGARRGWAGRGETERDETARGQRAAPRRVVSWCA
jgi:hypothetical protein